MQNVSIIRNRGQLTIPDRVRKQLTWVAPLSAVSIVIVRPDEIAIRPHQSATDWDKIWTGIKKARSISGDKGNLSAYIAEDRYNH
jgi:bifunctional DNA-binding transcriptional regulator/antitoxin component of YhaV-PrlF toxin-antitoxin module